MRRDEVDCMTDGLIMAADFPDLIDLVSRERDRRSIWHLELTAKRILIAQTGKILHSYGLMPSKGYFV